MGSYGTQADASWETDTSFEIKSKNRGSDKRVNEGWCKQPGKNYIHSTWISPAFERENPAVYGYRPSSLSVGEL